LELDWFGIIQNVKDEFLFISNTYFMLTVSGFFPRYDDWLGKRKVKLFVHNFIFIYTLSCFTKLHLHQLLIWIIIIIKMEQRVVLNKN
jgi:hypothetical protein